MPLTIGARLGLYEIRGSIGAGGMGEVYRADDPRLGRDVAPCFWPGIGHRRSGCVSSRSGRPCLEQLDAPPSPES